MLSPHLPIFQNNNAARGRRCSIDDIPKAAAGRALDAVIDSITGALKDGDSVVLVGFGTFAVKERAARTGRNPQTGQPIEISAAKIPSFKAGKALKDAVN